MVEKPPSSLDYACLLHELTLKKWMESILQNEWRRAEIAAAKLSESHDRFWSWLGSYDLAITHLCRGKSERALESLAVASQLYAEAPHFVASALITTSHVLNEIGQPARGVEPAERAVALCRRERPLLSEALFFLGQSRLRQGRSDEAEKIAAQWVEQAPGMRAGESRARYHQLRAEISLSRGDTGTANRELEKAGDALAEAAPLGSPGNLHVPIRFLSASSCLKAEQTSFAVRELEAIVRDKKALLNWPIPYVRSFFLLGKAYQGRGEKTQAARHLEYFIHHWKDGELDSDRVKEAETFLSDSTR